jgi:hypothetical protein
MSVVYPVCSAMISFIFDNAAPAESPAETAEAVGGEASAADDVAGASADVPVTLLGDIGAETARAAGV